MRSVVRPMIAVLLALSCVVLVAATVQASVRGSQQRSGGTHAAAPHSLAISITGVSPQFAESTTSTVTVSGTLSNHTGSAISGIQVQLQWYPVSFDTRSDMDIFAAGGPAELSEGQFSLQPVGDPYQLRATLANGATTHWSASFELAQSFGAYGISSPGFGDYPLQALASSTSSSRQASSQTFLPYWPGKSAATPLKVGWIWPLIDTPQQGACGRTLATDSLAGDLSAGGRLTTLANAGLQWASKDDLTWAIDPALLSDATVMTRAYFTGGNSECTDRTRMAADPAATSWLAKLAGTAGDSAFLTPYADVDVAALSHNGLDADVRSAYQLGDAEAAKILPGTFGPTANPTALAAAWPAGGTADAGVLTSLARDGGVGTVVLNSNELPSSMSLDGTTYDTAVARTKTSAGSSMPVLLADSDITSVLGSASARSSPGAQFAAEQDFLAQTAMIVAEGPNTRARSLVVAPPAGWDPSPAEAEDLLRLTSRAPWLRTADLGTLAAETARLPVERLPARHLSGDEFPAGYVDELQSLDASLALFEGILYQPPQSYLNSLAAAVAVTQSSAWRGSQSPGGSLAIAELSFYLQDQQHKVLLIPVKKILLAGTSGDTPVSVQNRLPPPLKIRVRVEASAAPGSTLQVTGPADPLVVNPGMTGTVRLHIHSATAVGTTTLQLQLTTSNGSPLTGASRPLSVEVTRFGRTILVIIFGALGVLVLATVVRLRRKRRVGGLGGAGSGDGERCADTDTDNGASSKAERRAHAGGAG